MAETTLNNREFYRNVLKIALPIAGQSLIGSTLSLVDNLMVGSLGEVQLASVGGGIQMFIIHWMFLFGFCSGSATFISQFYGKGDMVNIKKTIGFTTMISLGIGVVFFAGAMLFSHQIISIYTDDAQVMELGAKYIRIGAPTFLLLGITQPLYIGLRATQQTQIPMLISFLTFAMNTVLNYVFIFGKFGAPQLGTSGAATATLIARCIEMLLVVYIVFGRKNLISGKLREFTGAGSDLIKAMLRNNIPTTANESMWSIGQSMYMAAIGNIGVTAYAATQACHTINNVFVLAGFSIGDAALILIGQKLGQGDSASAKAMASKFIKLSAVAGAVMGGLVLVSSGTLIGLFDFTEEGVRVAERILIVYGCAVPLKLVVGVFITGILRGGGDTTVAAAIELSAVWFIGVPIAFIGAVALGLPAYIVVLMTLTVEVVELFVLIGRYRSGKWAKNVIENIK